MKKLIVVVTRLASLSALLLASTSRAELSQQKIQANEAKGVKVYKGGPSAKQKLQNRASGVREYSHGKEDRLHARTKGVKEYATSHSQGGGIGSAGALYGFVESRKMVVGARNSFEIRGALTGKSAVVQPLMPSKDFRDWLKNWRTGLSDEQIEAFLQTQALVGPTGAGLDEARAWLVHKGVKKAATMNRDQVLEFLKSTDQLEWLRPDALALERFLVQNGVSNAAQVGTQLWKLGIVNGDESTLKNLDGNIARLNGYGATQDSNPESLRKFFYGMFTTRAGHKVSPEENAMNEADKRGVVTEH